MTVLPDSRWATAQDYQRERGFSESAEGLALALALGLALWVAPALPLGAVSGTDVASDGVGSATGGTTASGVLGSAREAAARRPAAPARQQTRGCTTHPG
jgi:hypothetical protein